MNVSQWSVQYEIVCNKACSSLTWNPSLSRLRSPMIAVGSDDTNNSGSKVLIYEYSENHRTWQRLENVTPINDSVHDISFAPNVGRSYDLLGVATTKDVKILSIANTPLEPIAQQMGQLGQQLSDKSRYEIRVVASFEDHGSQVWRVSWNITGTILASSGDDGTVRLWKGLLIISFMYRLFHLIFFYWKLANYLENWKNVGILKGDGYVGTGISTSFHSDSNGSTNTQNRNLRSISSFHNWVLSPNTLKQSINSPNDSFFCYILSNKMIILSLNHILTVSLPLIYN